MIVPPFIPEPLEFPGNITEQPIRVRVRFIQRVVVAYFLTVLAIVGVAYLPLPGMGWRSALVYTFIALVGLSWVRHLARGQGAEPWWSLLLFPGLLVVLSEMIQAVDVNIGPPWAFAVGPAAIMVSTFIGGRDFSFMGAYVGGIFFSTLVHTALGLNHVYGPFWGWLVLANFIHISFVIYDLAMLTRRRKVGEEIGGAIDLYRDLLNFTTYPVRVWHHWQKHRIWIVRLDISDARLVAWKKVEDIAKGWMQKD